jgi:hypothetical protein
VSKTKELKKRLMGFAMRESSRPFWKPSPVRAPLFSACPQCRGTTRVNVYGRRRWCACVYTQRRAARSHQAPRRRHHADDLHPRAGDPHLVRLRNLFSEILFFCDPHQVRTRLTFLTPTKYDLVLLFSDFLPLFPRFCFLCSFFRFTLLNLS